MVCIRYILQRLRQLLETCIAVLLSSHMSVFSLSSFFAEGRSAILSATPLSTLPYRLIAVSRVQRRHTLSSIYLYARRMHAMRARRPTYLRLMHKRRNDCTNIIHKSSSTNRHLCKFITTILRECCHNLWLNARQ